MDRKCRTDTATRKLTIGWRYILQSRGYKARHCKYMTLVFINHRYFCWSGVTFQCLGYFTLLQSESRSHACTHAKSICISIPWNITQKPSITLYSDSRSQWKRSFPFLLPRLMCQQYTAITIAETRCVAEKAGKEIKQKPSKPKQKPREKPQYMV